jgi:hypothetical protein
MPRNRSAPEDAATARRILLDGLARDARGSELLGELEPLQARFLPVHLALLLIHPGRPAGYPVRQDRFSLAYRLVIERSFA